MSRLFPKTLILIQIITFQNILDLVKLTLLYYSGPIVLGNFEIIPILTYLCLTDQDPLTSAPIAQKIWPLTALIGMISKSPKQWNRYSTPVAVELF
jgi:hypothetical protein